MVIPPRLLGRVPGPQCIYVIIELAIWQTACRQCSLFNDREWQKLLWQEI